MEGRYVINWYFSVPRTSFATVWPSLRNRSIMSACAVWWIATCKSRCSVTTAKWPEPKRSYAVIIHRGFCCLFLMLPCRMKKSAENASLGKTEMHKMFFRPRIADDDVWRTLVGDVWKTEITKLTFFVNFCKKFNVKDFRLLLTSDFWLQKGSSPACWRDCPRRTSGCCREPCCFSPRVAPAKGSMDHAFRDTWPLHWELPSWSLSAGKTDRGRRSCL